MKRFLTIILLINVATSSYAQSLEIQMGGSRLYSTHQEFDKYNSLYLEAAYNISKTVAPVFYFSQINGKKYNTFSERVILRGSFQNPFVTPDTFYNVKKEYRYRINHYAFKMRINSLQKNNFNIHFSPHVGFMFMSEKISSNYRLFENVFDRAAFTFGFDIGLDYYLTEEKSFKLSADISSGISYSDFDATDIYIPEFAYDNMHYTQFRLGVSWIFQVGKEVIP